MATRTKQCSIKMQFLTAVAFIVTCFNYTNSYAQKTFSEAPIEYRDGQKFSQMVYVKFKDKVIDPPRGTKIVQIADIENQHADVANLLNHLSSQHGNFKIYKAIPRAKWGDNMVIHRVTKQPVLLKDMSQLFILGFDSMVPVTLIIDALKTLDIVEFSHGPIQARLLADPDDPFYQDKSQWYLATIQASKAWDITKGSGNVEVAVIEPFGVNRSHNDFVDENNVSKFVANKGDFTFDSSNNHGAEVAGIIGAGTNNATGIASLGWNIRMVPYHWTGWNLNGDLVQGNLAEQIDRIVQQDTTVDIINLSLETIDDCPLNPDCDEVVSYSSVETAINNVVAAGVLVVAAAGNGDLDGTASCPIDTNPCSQGNVPYISYPSSYSQVIAVSATTKQDAFLSGFNEGSFIDIAAPGETIKTTSFFPGTSNPTYTYSIGTSFSTPQVSALAGLILSINKVSPATVKQIIQDTAENPQNEPATRVGSGRINAHAAVLRALDDLPDRTSNSSLATAYNSGRRLVRDGSGNYHLLYQAGNQVFYAKYTGTWSADVRLSDGLGEYGTPSIAERGGNIFVTWQKKTGSTSSPNHDIYFHKTTDGGATWSGLVVDTNVGSSAPLPVIASPSSSNLVIAYRSGGNIVTKHSANNGVTWSTTRTLSGSANNSPSVAPGKTPWSANATVLAYATGEIPNSSDIIADYNYNTTWMSPKNLTFGLPGNLSQHAHPAIAFSGDFQNTTHVAWDAYDAFRLARVILHKKMTSWNNPGTYYEFAYQTEDRPTITGLAGAKAAMLFRRGPDNFFRGDYDGSTWSITFPTFAGKHPSLSVGQTQARYVNTSAGSAPYQVQLSPTTLSKSGTAVQTVALSRSAGFVHPASGGWLNIRMREYRVQHQDGSLSRVEFEPAPPDTGELDVGQVLAAVGSGVFVLPADAEFLNLTFSVAGNLVSRLAQEAGPLALQFKAVAHGATVQEFDFPKLTLADTESFLLAGVDLSLPAADLQQASGVSFKLEVTNQKRDASVVATLGHIYEIRDEPGPALPKLATRAATPLPVRFALKQNYPNPFNPETKIRYALPQPATVRLALYNLTGQEVRRFLFAQQARGEHTVVWDGRDSAGRQVGSGVYVYKLSVEPASGRRFEQSRKLVLVR